MQNEDIHHSEAAVGATLALAAADTKAVNEGAKPFVIVPPGHSVHDLESTLETPMRPRGTVSVRTVDSFIDYVNRYKTDGTTLYANDDVARPSFTAVFNDHQPHIVIPAASDGTADGSLPQVLLTSAGWRDFKAEYHCPLSKEWLIWNGKNGSQMSQKDFAQFIEDNLPDIREPVAAEMLTVARTLEAKKSVDFKSAQRLSNGDQEFAYVENTNGTAGNGSIKVPELFVLGLPVFNGGDLYRVEARLRYRIADGGKLTLWYELVRPHKIVEDAFCSLKSVIASETKLKAIVGSITA